MKMKREKLTIPPNIVVTVSRFHKPTVLLHLIWQNFLAAMFICSLNLRVDFYDYEWNLLINWPQNKRESKFPSCEWISNFMSSTRAKNRKKIDGNSWRNYSWKFCSSSYFYKASCHQSLSVVNALICLHSTRHDCNNNTLNFSDQNANTKLISFSKSLQ